MAGGEYGLADAIHLASGVSLFFDGATLRCPPGKAGINGTNVADVSLYGSATFVASAPGQVGIILGNSQRIVFDGAFAFTGWFGPNNVPAVIAQGNRDCRFAGWQTRDSSMLLCLGGTNLEIARMSAQLVPGAQAPTKALVNVMTNANFPTLSQIRVHDLDFDGGGILDVSFIRVRLDVMAGRSGSDLDVRSVRCRNGSPTSIWSDCFDSYGIVGCVISDVQADGCYTGVSVANSRCQVTNCVAMNCYSQGLVVGGAGQLGDVSDVVVTNFQARRCCRGTKLGPTLSNGQILADGTHGRIDNLVLRNCVGDATGSENGFHGLSINGVALGSCTIEGGQFVAAGGGQHLFLGRSLRPGAVQQASPPKLGP